MWGFEINVLTGCIAGPKLPWGHKPGRAWNWVYWTGKTSCSDEGRFGPRGEAGPIFRQRIHRSSQASRPVALKATLKAKCFFDFPCWSCSPPVAAEYALSRCASLTPQAEYATKLLSYWKLNSNKSIDSPLYINIFASWAKSEISVSGACSIIAISNFSHNGL